MLSSKEVDGEHGSLYWVSHLALAIDPVLNTTMVTIWAATRVYIFHDYQFGALVISPFFSLPWSVWRHHPVYCTSLFYPPCTRQMRRWILTCVWRQPTLSSQILWSLPTPLWSSWLRSRLLLRRARCPAWGMDEVLYALGQYPVVVDMCEEEDMVMLLVE